MKCAIISACARRKIGYLERASNFWWLYTAMRTSAEWLCRANFTAQNSYWIKRSRSRESKAAKKRRKTKQVTEKRVEEAHIEEEGVTYSAGGFWSLTGKAHWKYIVEKSRFTHYSTASLEWVMMTHCKLTDSYFQYDVQIALNPHLHTWVMAANSLTLMWIA